MIRLRTGNSIVRRASQRKQRCRFYRKYAIIVSLLIVVVAIQLVIDCRYTILAVISIASIYTSQDNITYIEDDFNYTDVSPLDSQWVTHNDSRMGLLFRLQAADASTARRALRRVGNRTCFVEGLDEKNGVPRVPTVDSCSCKADWFGSACSLPGFISRSTTPWSKDALRLRSRPRRVIYAFPFNIEFDMVQLRFTELADVVDVFLILESNYTAYGQPRPLRLLDWLRNGSFPQEVVAKVIHIFLDYFPAKARKDGWVADALHRNYLGSHGLRRLGDLRADDLLVLTDADELPRRQLLSFLRCVPTFQLER